MRLLVDINSLIYRAAYKHHMLHDAMGVRVGVSYGVLRSLEKIARRVQPSEMVICWDGSASAVRRKEIFPGYKSNRKRDPEFAADLERQRRVLASLLHRLPVVQIYETAAEADDVIAVLAEFLHLESVGILTVDSDLYPLARRKNHSILRADGSPARLDLEPASYLSFNVLVGKPSNAVPGVGQVGKVTARALIQKHGSLKSIVEATAKSGKLGAMPHAEARKVIARNLRLMRLGTLLEDSERINILNQYKRGRLNRKVDQDGVRHGLGMLGFNSFLARFTAFLAPFRRMEHGDEASSKALPAFCLHQESEDACIREEAEKGERQQYTKRVRKPAGGGREGAGRGPQGGAGEAPRGDAGGLGRPGPVGGGQKEEAETSGAAGRSTHAIYRRVRKAVAADAAENSTTESPAGAVRADNWGPGGARMEARSGGAVRPLEGLFKSERVRAKRRGRRDEAVFLLSSFKDDEGWQWLKRQGSEALRFVLAMCEAISVSKDFAPPARDIKRLQQVREGYLSEEPEWMKSKWR